MWDLLYDDGKIEVDVRSDCLRPSGWCYLAQVYLFPAVSNTISPRFCHLAFSLLHSVRTARTICLGCAINTVFQLVKCRAIHLEGRGERIFGGTGVTFCPRQPLLWGTLAGIIILFFLLAVFFICFLFPPVFCFVTLFSLACSVVRHIPTYIDRWLHMRFCLPFGNILSTWRGMPSAMPTSF